MSLISGPTSSDSSPVPQDPPTPPAEHVNEPKVDASGNPGRRNAVIGLVGGIILVAAALVVWLVVVPGVKSNNSVVTPTASVTPTQSAPPEEPVGHGVPDILQQPSGWSSAIPLDASADLSDSSVIETGIRNIVVVNSSSNLRAVDLTSATVLWSLSGYTYWITLDDGTGIVSNDGNGQIAKVDIQTGELSVLGTVPSGANVDYVDADVVITESFDQGQYCARTMANLDTCQWQASDDPVWGSAVFGGGKWVNTSDGVFNIATGQPAPFGKDSIMDEENINTVYYDGPEGGVGRFSVDQKSGDTVFQPWDTQNDVGLTAPVKISGWVDPQTYDYPWLFVHGDATGSKYSLTAYSWQTGEKVWQASPGLVEGDPGLWVFGNYAQVTIDAQDKPAHPDRPSSAIIDGLTGNILWKGNDKMISMAGQQAVYVGSDQPFTCSGTLAAYDGQNDGFPLLWTMSAPEDQVQFQAAAGHVVALSCTSGQMWVLRP